jgi:hypothetical protein
LVKSIRPYTPSAPPLIPDAKNSVSWGWLSASLFDEFAIGVVDVNVAQACTVGIDQIGRRYLLGGYERVPEVCAQALQKGLICSAITARFFNAVHGLAVVK